VKSENGKWKMKENGVRLKMKENERKWGQA
jgi:hypothetical protein